MNRVWEIREGGDYKHNRKMGMRDDQELREAYECGYDEGYEAAMEEMDEDKYNSRTSYRYGRRRM